MVRAESRVDLRRPARLGILSRQLAIATYCSVTDNERNVVSESLLQQKVGCNTETMKQY